jgi:integrase
MEQPWFKPFCILLYETGLRRKESLQLKVKDIIAGKFIHIYETKSGRERIIPISKNLSAVLLPYVKGMKALDRVFPFSSDHVSRVFRKYADMAGMPDKTLHGFRHGRVTKWQEEGFNTEEVRMMAGHSSIITTQGYSHLSAEGLYRKMNE